MLDEFLKHLHEMPGRMSADIFAAVTSSGMEKDIQAFVKDIAEKQIRPVIEAKIQEIKERPDKTAMSGIPSQTVYQSLSEALEMLPKYPEAWKLKVDEENLMVKLEISDRGIEVIATKIDRGTLIMPKVPHFSRVERKFLEGVSQIIRKLKLNQELSVLNK